MRSQTLRNVRDAPWVGAFVTLPSDGGVCNLCTDWGWYFRADISGGQVWVRRARWFTPPFDLEKAASPGSDDRHPALVRDFRERLWVLWQTGEFGVYRAYSDDDAATWSTPVVLFPGGKYPRSRACRDTGIIAHTAYLSGSIAIRIQTPGDDEPQAQRTIAGFGAIADEPFDVDWDHSGQRRLIFVVNSGSAIQEYVCTDPETDSPSVKLVT